MDNVGKEIDDDSSHSNWERFTCADFSARIKGKIVKVFSELSEEEE